MTIRGTAARPQRNPRRGAYSSDQTRPPANLDWQACAPTSAWLEVLALTESHVLYKPPELGPYRAAVCLSALLALASDFLSDAP
jgi:hypothetical protein